MGFFGAEDFDTTQIPEGPKAGVYPGRIKAVKTFEISNSGKTNHIFVIDMHDASFDYPVSRYVQFPSKAEMEAGVASWDDVTPVDTKGNTQKGINLQKLRRFSEFLIKSFGIPAERVNKVNPEDLVGTPVVVTITINDEGFPNAQRIDPPATSHTALPGSSAPVSAAPSVAPVSAAPTVSTPAPVSTPAATAAANPFPPNASAAPNPFPVPSA